ncbi:MAG: DUF2752 domain-containing protein [Bacteroidota bacterium]
MREEQIKYLFISLFFLIFLLLPDHFIFNDKISFCLHKYLLGIQCPFCGMIRATYLLTHFDLIQSMQYNAAVIFLPLYLLADITELIFPGKLFNQTKKVILVLFILALVIIYIYRIVTQLLKSNPFL